MVGCSHLGHCQHPIKCPNPTSGAHERSNRVGRKGPASYRDHSCAPISGLYPASFAPIPLDAGRSLPEHPSPMHSAVEALSTGVGRLLLRIEYFDCSLEELESLGIGWFCSLMALVAREAAIAKAGGMFERRIALSASIAHETGPP